MRADRKPSVIGSVPHDWEIVQLGKVLQRATTAVRVEPGEVYREIGIRSHGKGVFHKEPVQGAALGNKRVFAVVPRSLVFNIVFAWEGAVAVTSDEERGMVASHRFPMFVPTSDNLVDVEFLRRFFQSRLGIRLLSDASPGGAGRNRTLNQRFTAEIPLPVPPIREQRKIAAILSSVDDAIAKTEAVIEQVQVVKKGLMQQLLTRGMPGRHTKFKQTEIGEVPEAWEVACLGEKLERIDAGWSPQCETVPATGDEWGVLKVSAVSWGRFLWSENKRLPSGLEPRPDIAVRKGDLILSRANTPELVGRSVVVDECPQRLMMSDKLLRLHTNATLDCGYLNAVLNSPLCRRQIEDSSSGSSRSMKNISQEKLRSLVLPFPRIDEQREIVAALQGLQDSAAKQEEVLDGLGRLKNGLLSALISGRLRVPLTESEAA